MFKGIILMIGLSLTLAAKGQYKLSLTEAIQFARTQNKWIQAASIEEKATAEDRKDAYAAALPTIGMAALVWVIPVIRKTFLKLCQLSQSSL